jgi:hypothetical protein
MEKFQNREEYEKWKEARIRPKQDSIEPSPINAQPADQPAEVEEEKSAISFNCPSCKSENIQKASVLVSMGSKTLRATTVGVGGGSGGLNAGVGLSGGSITSELATRLSPPAPWAWGKHLPVWQYFGFPSFILMFSCACYNSFEKGYTGAGFTYLVLTILTIWLPYFVLIPSWKRTQTREENKYRQALARWQKTYYCLRCGTSFELPL